MIQSHDYAGLIKKKTWAYTIGDQKMERKTKEIIKN